ncbi:Fc.00g090710.m01.CDS01 [Cosmosporella sp. VM-42]
MPPAKSSRNHDDSKSDGHNSKEKNGNGHSSAKMRRGASQQSSHLREVTNAPTSVPVQPPAEVVPPSLQWSSFDRNVLHAYRREHRLTTPTSFQNPYHQWVLSHPGGIGIHSPTMMRRRKARRQGKDNLALAVRKHFNGVGIQENDVIVDFIYKIRNDSNPESKRQTVTAAQ